MKIRSEEKLRQLCTWLEERLADWEVMHSNGSPDFTVSTGVKLNEIRGQILLLRRDIRLLCDNHQLDYPDVAYEQIPPLVTDSYTVRRERDFHREIYYECVAEAGKPKQLSLF